MKNKNLALGLTIASYMWLAGTVLIGASAYPNYSHITQFMSELGAQGAPFAGQINLFGFLIVEILLLAGLGFTYSNLPKSGAVRFGFFLFLAYPILLAVAAFSPCDFECRPEDPSLTHNIHIISGIIAYLFAILGLAFLTYYSPSKNQSDDMKRLTYIAGPVLLICLINVSPDFTYVGLVQRLLETGIYAWLIYLLLYWRDLPTSANHENE